MGGSIPSRGTKFAFPGSASASCREDDELAALWGVTPKHAHNLKTHAARRAADVIRLRRAKQDFDGAARFAAPLVEVMEALPCPDAELREGVTDGEEDAFQTRYKLNPCAETARPLIRKRMEHAAALMDDTRRIAALHGITL